MNTPVEIVGLVLCAVLLTMTLGSPPVRRLVQPLTRPSIGWMFAPAAPRPQPVFAETTAAPAPSTVTATVPAPRSAAEQTTTAT